MADDKQAAPNQPAAPGEKPAGDPSAKKSKPALTYMVVAVATVLGGVVGTLVIAPRVIAARQPPSAEAEAKEGGEHGGTGKKGKEKGPFFKIENLIVNPAGSQGTRFLMVSVAVETADAAMEERLRSQEAQIRDVVISLLEQKTMDMLGAPGIRDSIKAQLADTISAIAGTRKLRVYLPQFVVQ